MNEELVYKSFSQQKRTQDNNISYKQFLLNIQTPVYIITETLNHPVRRITKISCMWIWVWYCTVVFCAPIMLTEFSKSDYHNS